MGANCSRNETIVVFERNSVDCTLEKRRHETPALDAEVQRTKNLQLLADRKKLDRFLLVRNFSQQNFKVYLISCSFLITFAQKPFICRRIAEGEAFTKKLDATKELTGTGRGRLR